ncbi:hypothetical protein J2T61_000670 [Methanocalculus sp. AMF5]|nr:hypothetical protein [Methanocalculus sp. AMF5]
MIDTAGFCLMQVQSLQTIVGFTSGLYLRIVPDIQLVSSPPLRQTPPGTVISNLAPSPYTPVSAIVIPVSVWSDIMAKKSHKSSIAFFPECQSFF